MLGHDDLDALLDELQGLDRVARSGFAQRGVPSPESVAEHSFHVAFLVWALGHRVEGLDLGRALALALLHDLGEARLGDLTPAAAGYLPAGAKRSAERAALADLLAPLGDRAQRAADEALGGRTLEARFVKACDRLQLQVKATHYRRLGLGDVAEILADRDAFDDGGFTVVREIFDALSSRRER